MYLRLTLFLLSIFTLPLFAQKASIASDTLSTTSVRISPPKTQIFYEKPSVANIAALLQPYLDSGYLAARVDSIHFLDTGTATAYAVYYTLDSLYYLQAPNKDSVSWTPDALTRLARGYARQELNQATIEMLLQGKVQPTVWYHTPVRFTTSYASAYPLTSIENHGEVSLSETLWYSLLGLKKGQAFNSAMLAHIDKVLASVSYLKPVYTSSLELLDTGALRLHLFVARRRTHFVEGELGFMPAPKTGNLVFFGNAQAHLENLFERGILLDLRWRGRGKERQQGALYFHYPFLFSSPWGIEVRLEAELRDSSHYKWSGRLGATYQLNGFHALHFAVERAQIQASEAAKAVQRSTLFWALGSRYRRYTWHNSWREGTDIGTELAIGQRTLTQSSSKVEGRYSLVAKYRQTIWRSCYLGGGLNIQGNVWGGTNRLELEGYSFGGTKHFRGIQESSLYTQQYAYLSFYSGVYFGNMFRLGGIFQAGELLYNHTVQYALSYGGELELRTNAGQLLLGMSRFVPLRNWLSAQNWLLHLQLQLTF